MKRALLPWLCLAAIGACGPGKPTSFPDQDKVSAAEKKWCDVLAELEGQAGKWSFQKECEAAYPTSSAPFLAKMADCYKQRRTDLGENAPDSAALVADCTEQILANVNPGDVSVAEPIRARCDRMLRCQKLAVEECQAAFKALEPSQQATLTAMYNLQAQSGIAQCLDDEPCAGADDDAVHDRCYRKQLDHRVWLPLALGPLEGTGPTP
jgi:predicted small lipoprotein YifL